MPRFESLDLLLQPLRLRLVDEVLERDSLIDGYITGAVSGGLAYLWQGNPYLGLVLFVYGIGAIIGPFIASLMDVSAIMIYFSIAVAILRLTT